MNEKQILKRIKNSIDETPIDILNQIKKEPRVKMLRHDKITEQEGWKDYAKKIMPYAAVVALFLGLLTNWQFQTTVPYAKIYMDVNPSIHLTTNRRDDVIKVEADNEEGKKIIEKVTFRGKTVEEVTQILLNKMVEHNYISNDKEYLLLSVDHKTKEKAERKGTEVDTLIHDYLNDMEISPIVLEQVFDKSEEIEELAKKYNISISKITFIKNIIGLGGEFEEKELVKLSITELVELIQENNLDLEKIIKTRDMEKIEEKNQKRLDDEATTDGEEEDAADKADDVADKADDVADKADDVADKADDAADKADDAADKVNDAADKVNDAADKVDDAADKADDAADKADDDDDDD